MTDKDTGRVTLEREVVEEALAALNECHEAMGYMSEYDIPLMMPKRTKDALDKLKQAMEV